MQFSQLYQYQLVLCNPPPRHNKIILISYTVVPWDIHYSYQVVTEEKTPSKYIFLFSFFVNWYQSLEIACFYHWRAGKMYSISHTCTFQCSAKILGLFILQSLTKYLQLLVNPEVLLFSLSLSLSLFLSFSHSFFSFFDRSIEMIWRKLGRVKNHCNSILCLAT